MNLENAAAIWKMKWERFWKSKKDNLKDWILNLAKIPNEFEIRNRYILSAENPNW